MSAPVPPPVMLARLRHLIATVAAHEQRSADEVMASLGLLAPTRWGPTPTHRPLTRTGVARMIESLRRRLPTDRT